MLKENDPGRGKSPPKKIAWRRRCFGPAALCLPSPRARTLGKNQQLPVHRLPTAPHVLCVDTPGGFNCR